MEQKLIAARYKLYHCLLETIYYCLQGQDMDREMNARRSLIQVLTKMDDTV